MYEFNPVLYNSAVLKLVVQETFVKSSAHGLGLFLGEGASKDDLILGTPPPTSYLPLLIVLSLQNTSES